MSTLAERLRGVVRSGGSASPGPPCVPVRRPGAAEAEEGPDPAGGLAALLDGEWRESSGQRYLVIDRTYPPGHRHGRIAVADAAPGGEGGWPVLSVVAAGVGPGRMLFFDLETTGLAGGAGTCAFLVGCGWFDGPAFRIRQFLLARYGAERGLLDEVAALARGAGAVATYNGKTFDLPLIETRFLFHRMDTPFAGMPHVDMLHVARRLWSGGLEPTGADTATSCRLAEIEQSVLGHVRAGDVPGCEIPSRYFQYVRSGDGRPLAAVLEHNRLDLLSLALLTARTAGLLDGGAEAAGSAREALGLGRLYRRDGRAREAEASFARAAAMTSEADAQTAAAAWHAYATSLRHARRYEEAAAAWSRVMGLRACPPRLAQEASEALAVHHEHRDINLRRARDLARQALELTGSPGRAHAVRRRLARLERRLAAADLF
ncbi:MAG: ribonuclease H-like domain-containing protein [Acidobacteria bacterium]|nr:ribonuclease H-like domain-containing protein [Acidobacteriota bacterium]